MIIVSDTKLRQVKEAIENWLGGVIVLRGPSGSGKHTALMHVCDQVGIATVEHCPEDGHDFVSTAARLDSISNGKTVLVSRDSKMLPTVVKSGPNFPRVVAVFLMDEDDMSYRNQTGTFVIAFNAFSDTAIRTLVACKAREGIQDLEEIVSAAGGDARQALRELEVRGNVIKSPGEVEEEKVRRKRKKTDESSRSTTARKDNAYLLFHTIGKILYNKEGSQTDCEFLVRQPVIADSGDVALLTLHENVPDFVDEIETFVNIAKGFSLSDIYFASSETRDLFIFKSIVCYNFKQNHSVGRNSFRAFRKSGLGEVRNKKNVSMELLSCLKEYRADYRILSHLDFILIKTNGVEPTDLSIAGKRAVFNLLHVDGVSFQEEPVIEPKELEDDPIEDC